MRPHCFLLLALFLIPAALTAQTIYVADQNANAPSGNHVFADLQKCIDAASPGDIIHVIPATKNYGNVTIDKELHLIGSGTVPDNPAGKTSKIASIVLAAGKANGTTLNGLVLTAQSTYPIVFGIKDAVFDTLKNIEIFNCKVPGMEQTDSCALKDITIRNNIISVLKSTVSMSTLSFNTEDGMTEDLIICNNIICNNYSNGNLRTGIDAANNTLIANNLLYSNSGFYFFSRIRNCTIVNNVFFGSSAQSISVYYSINFNYGNNFSNNLSFNCTSYGGCDIPPVSTATPANTGSGNLVNTDPEYVNLSPWWIWDISNSLEFSDTSPLINGGTDGTDIGVTGGMYPFDNYSHLRAIPYVHSMSVPALLQTNQPIQLDAELRSDH